MQAFRTNFSGVNRQVNEVIFSKRECRSTSTFSLFRFMKPGIRRTGMPLKRISRGKGIYGMSICGETLQPLHAKFRRQGQGMKAAPPNFRERLQNHGGMCSAAIFVVGTPSAHRRAALAPSRADGNCRMARFSVGAEGALPLVVFIHNKVRTSYLTQAAPAADCASGVCWTVRRILRWLEEHRTGATFTQYGDNQKCGGALLHWHDTAGRQVFCAVPHFYDGTSFHRDAEVSMPSGDVLAPVGFGCSFSIL